jgi:hypothetical protein
VDEALQYRRLMGQTTLGPVADGLLEDYALPVNRLLTPCDSHLLVAPENFLAGFLLGSPLPRLECLVVVLVHRFRSTAKKMSALVVLLQGVIGTVRRELNRKCHQDVL